MTAACSLCHESGLGLSHALLLRVHSCRMLLLTSLHRSETHCSPGEEALEEALDSGFQFLLRLGVCLQAAAEGTEQPSTSGQAPQSPARPGLQFSDRDEHLYFWFPLLAGLSELTFEPQPDIRNGALGVSVLSPDLILHASAEIIWMPSLCMACVEAYHLMLDIQHASFQGMS